MSTHNRLSLSSSDIDQTTRHLRGASETSEDRHTERSHRSHRSHRPESQTNNGELGSIAEKSVGRNHSLANSQASTTAAGIPYDVHSVTSKTGATSSSQRNGLDNTSAVRSSISQEQQLTTSAKPESVHQQEPGSHRKIKL
jgi:hypothetical protein